MVARDWEEGGMVSHYLMSIECHFCKMTRVPEMVGGEVAQQNGGS